MESPHIIREKALRLAIRTGVAPDPDFVWQWQRFHGCATCFGSFKDSCPAGCRWHEACEAFSTERLDRFWPIPRTKQRRLRMEQETAIPQWSSHNARNQFSRLESEDYRQHVHQKDERTGRYRAVRGRLVARPNVEENVMAKAEAKTQTNGTLFQCDASAAKQVFVAGTFNHWEDRKSVV